MNGLSSGNLITPRRLRPAAARMSSGASSLLRLARGGGDARLPSAPALTGWVERVSGMMDLTPLGDEPAAAVRAGSPGGRA
ncbi:MAG: hypothetical protein JSR84_11720 [Proteobacteria bacterium]|nr:hypothetical protein [Pseudomonadota bacterium]